MVDGDGAFLSKMFEQYCAEVGIEGRIQHVEYLANWLDVLKNDKNAILRASSKAQASADHIMGRDQIEYAKVA